MTRMKKQQDCIKKIYFAHILQEREPSLVQYPTRKMIDSCKKITNSYKCKVRAGFVQDFAKCKRNVSTLLKLMCNNGKYSYKMFTKMSSLQSKIAHRQFKPKKLTLKIKNQEQQDFSKIIYHTTYLAKEQKSTYKKKHCVQEYGKLYLQDFFALHVFCLFLACTFFLACSMEEKMLAISCINTDLARMVHVFARHY